MIKLTSVELSRIRTDTLIIPICADQDIHRSATLRSLCRQAKGIKTFQAESGEVLTRHHPKGLKAQRIFFVGLGQHAELTLEKYRQAAGQGIRLSQHKRRGDAVLAIPDGDSGNALPKEDVLSALAEGALLTNHSLDDYKSEQKTRPLKSIRLHTDATTARKSQIMLKRIAAICTSTLMARDWVNLPANDKTPQLLAQRMAKAAQTHGVKATIMDEKKLRRLKMGALLAVGIGSAHPPRLLILEYHPPKARGTIALVGKGVTFDAGGLNMKPTGSIELMKIDMAGAAAVAATVIATAQTGSRQRVVGLIPLAENMVSGEAFRPGDIVRAYDGQSIEIGNTDAEGRLILADALAYAAKAYRPRVMIDMATLTGACVVALGEKIAGLFTPDERLLDLIREAGEQVHERCWPMPLPEDYHDLLKSELADMRNIGPGRWGGAIVAALFLSKFTGKTRWAHIDIAGPAYQKKEQPYGQNGATGFGVRLLCRTIAALQKETS